jgi:transposase
MENVAAREPTYRIPRAATTPVIPPVKRPQVSFGSSPLARTTEQSPDFSIARTRQVTVSKIICGVDVSSDCLQARIGCDGPERSFSNATEGIAELAGFCRQHGVELVAMEATGGYEKQPFSQLWALGLAVAILNPRSVRRFAEGMGLLEKTDRIDAGVIAWFAQVKRCAPCTPASAQQEHLQALVTRLRQLTELQTMQRNQRLLVTDPTVLASFTQVLALVAFQIRALAAAISELIAADPLWQQLDQAFRSIKGVAERTVACLMAEMPEIGTLSNKAISKLAGLAPLARDSGSFHGKRPVRGGRAEVRGILFVVASVVRRHDPDFAAFDRRLTAAGKPKKVIRVALAHKLLVRLNAKARQVRHHLPETASGVVARG